MVKDSSSTVSLLEVTAIAQLLVFTVPTTRMSCFNLKSCLKYAYDNENAISRRSANLFANCLPIHWWYLVMYSLSTPSSSRLSFIINFPGIKMLSWPWTPANVNPISRLFPIGLRGLNRKYAFSQIFDTWILDWHIYTTGRSHCRIQLQLQEFEENVRTSVNKIRKMWKPTWIASKYSYRGSPLTRSTAGGQP